MKFGRSLGGGEPLRTFSEMAEEFGISPQTLSAEMARSKIAHPKSVSTNRATMSGQPHRTYYKPSEMRRWWKAHKESKCSTSDS